jgi:hypothetical protein
LNEWCAPPLRLHVSDDSNFLIISDVPSRAVFVNNLLNAFLVFYPIFLVIFIITYFYYVIMLLQN